MKIEKVIKQLESILDHTRSMAASPNADDIWKEDIDALEFSIAALRSMAGTGEPLSLEQLKQMDGKPVWVEFIGHPDGTPIEPLWMLVNCREKRLVTDIEYVDWNFEGWFAYPYPPAHIDVKVFCGNWEGEADGYADGELVYDVWRCGDCGHVEETDDPDLLPRFCPRCGRAMTPEAWTELERRLRG